MAEQTIKYIKDNWMTLANFVILISLVFKIGYASSTIDSTLDIHAEKIDKNRVSIFMHSTDATYHMPYEKTSTLFVPRVEIDGRLNNIEKALERIEKNQKKE